MGERDNRINKQTMYYFGNGEVLTEVFIKRKKLLRQFEDSSLQAYIKENKINWRKEAGLIEIIKFLNTEKWNIIAEFINYLKHTKIGYLFDKINQWSGTDNNWKNHTENCPIKMRIMIDTIRHFSCLVIRINQV